MEFDYVIRCIALCNSLASNSRVQGRVSAVSWRFLLFGWLLRFSFFDKIECIVRDLARKNIRAPVACASNGCDGVVWEFQLKADFNSKLPSHFVLPSLDATLRLNYDRHSSRRRSVNQYAGHQSNHHMQKLPERWKNNSVKPHQVWKWCDQNS